MFNHDCLNPRGSFRGRQEEKWGSFRGQFGDHFRVGDHFGVGIISGGCTIPAKIIVIVLLGITLLLLGIALILLGMTFYY